MTRGGLALEGVAKRFDAIVVLESVDLEVAPGELLVVVGPSGCGKSTLLRLVAGLEAPSAGRIFIGGRDVTAVPPARRGIAMVFQSYALYPHMSVAQNMGFGLKIQGRPKQEIAERVARAADILQLGDYLDRKPRALSGGQRQRVAIGRAIVRDPDVFLFDEPLSNLDAALRGQMRVEIARLHAQLGATMLYVTHDQVEAMTLATTLVILNAGRIEQVGTPLDLYRKPANQFVAGFLGAPRMNFLAARVLAPAHGILSIGLSTAPGAMPLRLPRAHDAAAVGAAVSIGIRPEHLRIADTGNPGALHARVSLVERLGAETLVYAKAEGGEQLTLRLDGAVALVRGDAVGLQFDVAHCHLFGADGAAIGAPPERAAAPPVAVRVMV